MLELVPIEDGLAGVTRNPSHSRALADRRSVRLMAAAVLIAAVIFLAVPTLGHRGALWLIPALLVLPAAAMVSLGPVGEQAWWWVGVSQRGIRIGILRHVRAPPSHATIAAGPTHEVLELPFSQLHEVTVHLGLRFIRVDDEPFDLHMPHATGSSLLATATRLNASIQRAHAGMDVSVEEEQAHREQLTDLTRQ